MKSQRKTSTRNRTGRMTESQEARMKFLESSGFKFQKLFREGMELIISRKMEELKEVIGD
jgi:hypothetical protein